MPLQAVVWLRQGYAATGQGPRGGLAVMGLAWETAAYTSRKRKHQCLRKGGQIQQSQRTSC